MRVVRSTVNCDDVAMGGWRCGRRGERERGQDWGSLSRTVSQSTPGCEEK